MTSEITTKVCFSPPKGKYIVYRQWGTKEYARVDTAKKVWDKLGELPFGEGYCVGHENPNLIDVSEFIHF